MEAKNLDLLHRLRQLRKERCCSHFEHQIGLWYRANTAPSLPSPPAPESFHQPTPKIQHDTITNIKEEPLEIDKEPIPLEQIELTAGLTTNGDGGNEIDVDVNVDDINVDLLTSLPALLPPPPSISEQSEQILSPPPPPAPPAEPFVLGCLLSNIKHLEGFDSDATLSTSSEDSYDELEDFSHEDIPKKNPHYYYQPSTSSAAAATAAIGADHGPPNLKKKAIWKWALERSRLASRWTWLQAQVADLEFRIRSQNDATMLARKYKTAPLPHALPENSCSRTVPISKDFRRRRLIKAPQILSDLNKKQVKFSHVPCVCSSLPQTVAPCLSCNGRYNYLVQLDADNAPLTERISLLDPCCHPVLSLPDDLTLGSQLAYLLKQETINRKPTKGKPGRKKGSTAANLAAAAAAAAAAATGRSNGDKAAKHSGKKGKYYTGMVGRPPKGSLKNPSRNMLTSDKLKRKYMNRHSNQSSSNNNDSWPSNHYSNRRNKRFRSTSSINDSSVCSESSNHFRPSHFSHNSSAQGVTRRRRSEQSAYDIDNIVIPFSIAATTRVEILEYKEIMTPSWRIWENGSCQSEVKEEEVEDTSDEAYISRHSKGESEEKKRFSLKPPKNSTANNATTANNNSDGKTASTTVDVPIADAPLMDVVKKDEIE